MNGDNRAVAGELAARGLHVFPLAPDSKRPLANCMGCAGNRCSGPGCGCTVGWCHGFYAATLDREFIAARFPARSLVGVATEASGLCVVDVEAAGVPWMRRAVENGLLSPTTAYRSASGRGFHLYYSGVIPSRLRPNGEAVDVKSAGAYVRWTGELATDRPTAPVPSSLTAWLERPARKEAAPRVVRVGGGKAGDCPTVGKDGRPRHRSPRYIAGAVAMAAKVIGEAPDGQGSVTVARVCSAFVAKHSCCATPEDYEAVREAARGRGHDPGQGWEQRFSAYTSSTTHMG